MNDEIIEIKNKLEYNAGLVNAALEKYLNLSDNDYNVLHDSMRYSALSAGKRIRAFLAVEFFKMFYVGRDDPGATCKKFNNVPCEKSGGVPGGHALQVILPIACAIEMIHAYSLVHDDLPCMDDDDFRRGLPSNHKKFGEATALLAGDALLTYAFNVIANAELLTDDKKVKIISEISRAAGHSGMIGGQMMDILYENKNIDVIRLIKTHMLKTGNMIIVSARAGCIAGGANEEETNKTAEYAKNIGLAFQVIDDMLDGQNSFSTGASAFEYAKKLTAEALENLEELKKANKNIDTNNLEILAKYLLERKN